MHIDISGHHVDVTTALKEYVETKLARLERHYDNVTDVHVVLEVEKDRHQAEATVQVTGSKLFAHAVSANMYAAVDALADKLDRQVRRHKEKVTDHHRSEGGIKAHPPEEV
jgi:putative sigma-54 modulation protein